MNPTRTVFTGAGRQLIGLLSSDAVRERWAARSVLPDMTVGALAGHLGRAASWSIEEYLSAPPPVAGTPLVSAAEYYARVPLDVGDAVHRGVLERGAQIAELGPLALCQRVADSLARLSSIVASLAPDHRITVLGTTPMNFDEYLKTRIVETVLHCDDLALSAGIDPPAIDEQTGGIIAHLSIDVARRRSGEQAVVRAFYRRERQSCDALRVF